MLAAVFAAPLLLVAACGNGGTDALGEGDSADGGAGGEVVIALIFLRRYLSFSHRQGRQKYD
jgi:hypothetical protein